MINFKIFILMLNENNLTDAMVVMAQDLTADTTIAEATVVESVLPDNGAPDGTNLSNTFYLGVKWTIARNGGINKDWPAAWGGLTFRDLARNLLTMLVLLLSLGASSQLVINLNGSRTDLKTGAIAFTIDYLHSLDSMIGGKEALYYGKKSIFQVVPAFHIQAGSADALSSITAKLTGLLLTFKTKETSTLVIPDFGHTFYSFPVSAGMETDDRFSFINTVAEVGFVPVFSGRDNPAILRHTTLGIYLQGGYKFKTTDSLASTLKGGDRDGSEEAVNTGILRAHGALRVDTKGILTVGAAKFGLVGSAEGWADFVNGAFYHRLDGILRTYVSENFMLDFIYQHGSGAPLFNEGDQIGVGLTAKF